MTQAPGIGSLQSEYISSVKKKIKHDIFTDKESYYNASSFSELFKGIL